MGKRHKRHFTEEDTQRASKHTESCSISLAIRAMQTKTTMRYRYAPVRIAKIKNK